MTRLLIADDHPFILAGVEGVLQGAGFEIVAKLADGQSVLNALASTNPDILLLDVAMPVRSGFDVLRTLRARGDERAIVLLTASLDDPLLLEAINLKVEGIVLKEGAQNLLLECLNAVRQGGSWMDPALTERAHELTAHGCAVPNPLAAITARERAIVGLAAQGVRNREIADQLGITEGTVKVYLHRIYEKLGVSNRTELALLARSVR